MTDLLLKALEPFANLAASEGGDISKAWPDDAPHWTARDHEWGRRVTVQMLRDAREAIAAWNARSPLGREEVARALAGIADDFMTSEKHHPGYVLIPTAKFEQLRDADAILSLIASGSGNMTSVAESTDAPAFGAAEDGLRKSEGEEFLEFKEALADLRSLRKEHEDLNGGGPNWSYRNAAAWGRVDALFANEDEAAWVRQQEDAHG